ncbi:MAG: polymer-forming cytoskeletal protein, partial [Paraburkholderia graminis]
VTGNIYYQQLRMDCGASVDGKLTRRDGGNAPTPLTSMLDAGRESNSMALNEA